MAGILLKHVSKTYPNGYQAVKDFDLEIAEAELVVLTGPEGCGKTTLLKIIAGLEEPTSGRVYIGDRDVTEAEPRERGLAMLFRNSTLYPGMTVYENLAFALRMEHMPQEEMDSRISKTAELLQMGKILSEHADELAFEDRIKVLLGRAVVRKPQLLLADGIMSGLDAEQREKVRREFLNLHRNLGLTIVFVTDNPQEAMKLGTKVVVMQDGVIRQAGSPEELYERPDCIFVAGFMGKDSINLFIVTPQEKDGRVVIDFPAGSFCLPEERGRRLAEAGYTGKEIAMGIRPEGVRPADGQECPGEHVILQSVLQDIEVSENGVFWNFGTEESGFEVRANEQTAEIGDQIRLAIDLDRIYLFDRETRKVIV